MKQFAGVIAIASFLFGCSSPADPVVTADVVADIRDATGLADVDVDEQGGTELSIPEVLIEVFAFDDVEPEIGPLCEAGEGCFLDPCNDNEECLSGWCVEHMGEAVCTQGCVDECPPGWECRQIAGGVDIAYI